MIFRLKGIKVVHVVKFRDGITNGAAWYVIEGGMQDWSYVFTSDMEITMEIRM